MGHAQDNGGTIFPVEIIFREGEAFFRDPNGIIVRGRRIPWDAFTGVRDGTAFLLAPGWSARPIGPNPDGGPTNFVVCSHDMSVMLGIPAAAIRKVGTPGPEKSI